MEWERVISTSNEEHEFDSFGLAVHAGETEFPLLTGKVGLPRKNSIHYYGQTIPSYTQSLFIRETSTVTRRLDEKNEDTLNRNALSEQERDLELSTTPRNRKTKKTTTHNFNATDMWIY